MRYLIPFTLIVTAVIHLMPVAGALGPEWLERLYGLPVAEPNLEILMRHRAILFGLVGAFLLTAAFRPALRGLAFAAGLASVSSFLFLAWSVGGYNSQIARVFTADLVALACLLAGGAAHLFSGRTS